MRFRGKCGEQFGAFEAMFALACLYFQESDCELMVFEAGIGGRYDPVRLLGSHVTTVTSVDHEHVELLGHSLELIVSDKSDACASSGVIIYGENCRPLRPHILEYNRNRNVESLFIRDEIRIGGETVAPAGQTLRFCFRRLMNFAHWMSPCPAASRSTTPPLRSRSSCRWLEHARPREKPTQSEAAVRSGLRNTRWPGRLETIGRIPSR